VIGIASIGHETFIIYVWGGLPDLESYFL
jgi:hypothetical protein